MAAGGPLAAQGVWQPPAHRRDPVEILIEQGKNRIEELLPVRYARMQTDPFTFLRGAAAMMAADLASMPVTGLRVQSCGDCHLNNFGAYASPEGTPVFDINDFDETLPAPFEWDVKRLAASLAVAGRVAHTAGQGLPPPCSLGGARRSPAHGAVGTAPPLGAGARASISPPRLPTWLGQDPPQPWKSAWPPTLKATKRIPALVEKYAGAWRIRTSRPLVHHRRHELHARKAFRSLRRNAPQEDRRVLLQRYHLHDVAFKVVGIGSVARSARSACRIGRRGAVAASIKEAQEIGAGPLRRGLRLPQSWPRVVVGQRMLQAATDISLGWIEGPVNADISTSAAQGLPSRRCRGPS